MIKRKFLTLFFTFSLITLSLSAVESLFSPSSEPKIFVNNRVLAKVQGRPITAYDLMKKMDMTFYKRYPEYASSAEARYEFYLLAWRHFLEDLIDNELILADAKQIKMQVTSGDVRQEMESTFGPNIVANLDKVGITFDEAAKIVEEEMIIDRMIAGRVHSKAIRQVTPQKIRQSYEEHIKDPANTKSTEWVYRSITIKERTLAQTEEVAQRVHELLIKNTPLEEIEDKLKENQQLSKTGKVTVSAPLKTTDQELSPKYKEVLDPLKKGEFSLPFSQKSRATNTTVYRILLVDDKIPGGTPSYNDLESTLKSRLMNEAVENETRLYFEKLREHHHIRPQEIEAMLPKDYQPFMLKK